MFSQTYKVIMMVVLWTVALGLLVAAVVLPGSDVLLCAWAVFLALGGTVYTLWYFGIHQTQRVEREIKECVERPVQRIQELIDAFVTSMEQERERRRVAKSSSKIDRIH